MTTTTPAAPARGQWVTITMTDGDTRTCRFVRGGTFRSNNRRYWYVDHGAYGSSRNDYYLAEAMIAAVKPAGKPRFLLTITPPDGKRRKVGRFATQQEVDKHLALSPDKRFNPEIFETAG